MSREPVFTIYRTDLAGTAIGKPITVYADGAVLGIDGNFTVVNRIPMALMKAKQGGYNEGYSAGLIAAKKNPDEAFFAGSQWTKEEIIRMKQPKAADFKRVWDAVETLFADVFGKDHKR